MYLEPMEHPDITYIERNGEPPLCVIKVADGICETVELTDEEISEIFARRASHEIPR